MELLLVKEVGRAEEADRLPSYGRHEEGSPAYRGGTDGLTDRATEKQRGRARARASVGAGALPGAGGQEGGRASPTCWGGRGTVGG